MWLDIPAPGASGVLFAHGSHFGGHTLYVKDNRLHYVYNFVGMLEQKIVATEDLPVGENLIVSASFVKDGEDPPGLSTGIVSLYHGEEKVGEGRIKTQPATFGLTGSGLTVGRSLHAITYDYPGERPWHFTGGTIHFGAVDVSGEPVRRPRARGRRDDRPRIADALRAQPMSTPAEPSSAAVRLIATRDESVGGGRLLVSDCRVAFLLLDEARRRVIERVFGVPRDTSFLVTIVALGTLAEAVHRKVAGAMSIPGSPSIGDAVVGASVLRESVHWISGEQPGESPLLGTLVTIAVLGAIARPAAAGSFRGVKAASRRTRKGFDYFFRDFVRFR